MTTAHFPPSASHSVAFYATDRFLVDRIGGFVSDGLLAGEQVLAVATNAHWTAVAERLDELGVPHGRAAEQGRLIVADAEGVLEHIMVDGVASPERFAEMLAPLLKGSQRRRIYGEVVALLAARGQVDAAVAIEEIGRQLARDRDIQILCSYHDGPDGRLGDSAISRIRAVHDHSFVEPLPDPPTSGHFHAVRFYKDDVELSSIVASFLAEGLGAADAGIVIATSAHGQKISEQLHGRGFDVQRLQDEQRLFVIDATAALGAFMVDGMPDRRRFRQSIVPLIEAASGGERGRTVRAYGEMVDVLWREGRSVAAVRLEMLWNELAKTHDFSLLCGYAMGQFYKSADVRDICAQHSHVVSASGAIAPVA